MELKIYYWNYYLSLSLMTLCMYTTGHKQIFDYFLLKGRFPDFYHKSRRLYALVSGIVGGHPSRFAAHAMYNAIVFTTGMLLT